MTTTIPITYGEFYDLPRMIEFQHGGHWFLMRSYFNEERNDYADFYDVYLLPFQSEEELKSNPDYWMELDKAIHLGAIAITEVGLDETRRKSIDARLIDPRLSARMQVSP